MTLAIASALLLALLASALATRLAIAYGLHRQLIDMPGGRRLHRTPTVRGAGVGCIAVLVFSIALAAWQLPAERAGLIATVAALALVSLVGWWDDHRPLSARWRLLAQLLAVLLLAQHWLASAPWPTVALTVLALTWLINAYNFIDGSDAFAGGHAVWVSACCALASGLDGDWLLAIGCALLCAVTSGFLVFNWPPARAFLGDVASGTLGLALGSIIVLGWSRASLDPLLPVLLISGVVLDATLTLLLRVLAGRRWYSAHRSHLYQWLIRSGWRPQTVLFVYLGWSALAAASFWLLPQDATWRLLGVAMVLTIGSTLWWSARYVLRQRIRTLSRTI